MKITLNPRPRKKNSAVMTIHGFLAKTEDFGVLYDKLKPYYAHIEKCEIPGHNGEVNFKLFKFQETLDAVYQTFDRLKQNFDTVDVIGHSMGGALATMLACTRQVNKVVLLSPANKYINASSFFNNTKYYFKSFRDAYNSCDGKLSEKWKFAETSMKNYLEDSKLSFNWAFTRFIPNLTIPTYRVFKQIITHCNQCLSQSEKISTPALLMWGELDELVPNSSIAFVEQHFSCVKKIIYANVGHAMTMTTQGKKISHDIVRFLSDSGLREKLMFKKGQNGLPRLRSQ